MLSLSVMNFIVAVIWTVYGYLLADVFVQVRPRRHTIAMLVIKPDAAFGRRCPTASGPCWGWRSWRCLRCTRPRAAPPCTIWLAAGSCSAAVGVAVSKWIQRGGCALCVFYSCTDW